MATDLPPNVASGELITSAWGNAVVNELKRKRGSAGIEVFQAFSHVGGSSTTYGTFDNGTTTIGPYPYPVRVAVIALCKIGFGQSGIYATADIVRVSDGSAVANGATDFARASSWSNITLPGLYNVAAGVAGGFKTRTIFTSSEATPITCYYSAGGLFLVQRTDF